PAVARLDRQALVLAAGARLARADRSAASRDRCTAMGGNDAGVARPVCRTARLAPSHHSLRQLSGRPADRMQAFVPGAWTRLGCRTRNPTSAFATYGVGAGRRKVAPA